jgi:hypothetical protein
MTEVGTMNMRTPSGGKSAFVVSLNDKGGVDIVFRRTSEGEALIRISRVQARELGELLQQASQGEQKGGER